MCARVCFLFCSLVLSAVKKSSVPFCCFLQVRKIIVIAQRKRLSVVRWWYHQHTTPPGGCRCTAHACVFSVQRQSVGTVSRVVRRGVTGCISALPLPSPVKPTHQEHTHTSTGEKRFGQKVDCVTCAATTHSNLSSEWKKFPEAAEETGIPDRADTRAVEQKQKRKKTSSGRRRCRVSPSRRASKIQTQTGRTRKRRAKNIHPFE